MKQTQEGLFFELLQVALGTRDTLSRVPSAIEWGEIKDLCLRHALPGVGFYAIRKLSDTDTGLLPPRVMILEQYALERNMLQANAQQIEDARRLTELFKQEGFGACVLKGCSLAGIYPNGMARMSGDIDIWVVPRGWENDSLRRRRKRVITLCRRVAERREVFYHHTDLPLKGKHIEVHFTPSWMFAPWHNANLQRFFAEEWPNRCWNGDFYVPSVQMNAVYVLLHIYRHLFDEGIGLRQVIDYYFVLKNDVGDKERVIRILKSVGLYKFAGAMMWVLHEVLNMPKEYMLCPADEARGKQLLDEIMQAGNFGKYDERLSSLNRKSLFSRLKQNINRNIRLMRYYPSESICSPFWKIWQKLWQLYNGYGAKPL